LIPRSIKLRKSTEMPTISANCSCVSLRDVRMDLRRSPNEPLKERMRIFNSAVVSLRIATEHHYGKPVRRERAAGDGFMRVPYINKAMTAALDRAREAQTEFWDALSDLEQITGIADVDGTQDLRSIALSDLFRQAAGRK